MKHILETERLRVRELNNEDSPFILELLNTPGWLRFIGDRNVRTIEHALSYLENGPFKSYRENGFGLYMVETKQGKTPAGICGILKRDTLDHPDIGFAFLPQHSGFGYAKEVAKATLNYAGEVLSIPRLLAITKPDNRRSIGLLESIGFSFVETLQLKNETDHLLLYRIDFDQNGADL